MYLFDDVHVSPKGPSYDPTDGIPFVSAERKPWRSERYNL